MSFDKSASISDITHHSVLERRQVGARRMAAGATAIVVLVYALLLAVTRTLDQGDTGVYADDIVQRLHGQSSGLWEFGHAIWRPIGFTLLRVFSPGSASVADAVAYSRATVVLTIVSVLGGALALISFVSWLNRLGIPAVTSSLIAAGLSCSAAFLGYAQTGASYIPALGMFVLGLSRVAAADDESLRWNVLWASLAFAAAVLFWFPMVLAVPAAAISMIVLRGDSPRRRLVAFTVCAISGSLTIVVYLLIARLAGVRSVAEFRAWMSQASNGIAGLGGLSRVVVGFGRSILNMDRLGLITKRHLVHDPYNPTTWGDILSGGLLRLFVVYAVLAVATIALLRKPVGRRVFAFLVLTAIPVVGFALIWQGGDLERYLAMFPALFLALAIAISTAPESIRLGIAGLGVISLAMANVPAISRFKNRQECGLLSSRLGAIPRDSSAPNLALTPHAMDEIASFRSRCPSDPLLINAGSLRVFGLVMPHTVTAAGWRDTLASRAARTWERNGRVWIARRAFRATPPADWKWTEGDEPSVRWRDFPAYFDSVDVGPPVGGADGFVELLPTPRTLQQLRLAHRQ
jgi:hypothetical protein